MNYMNYAAKKRGTSDKMSKGREQIEQENVVIRTFREEDIAKIVSQWTGIPVSKATVARPFATSLAMYSK